jgi:hypothetical protein
VEKMIKNRWELIQAIIDKHNFSKYLEIGVVGAGDAETFLKIKCELKVGIDPAFRNNPNFKDGPQSSGTLYAITSDNFFFKNMEKFDVVFVDGLHLYEQVIRDTVNSWNCLNNGGYIVIHDCLPTNEWMRTRERKTQVWTGDVWKAIIWFRQTYPDLFCKVLDIDWGCGVIFKDSPRVLNMPDNVADYMNLEFRWTQVHQNVVSDIKEILGKE